MGKLLLGILIGASIGFYQGYETGKDYRKHYLIENVHKQIEKQITNIYTPTPQEYNNNNQQNYILKNNLEINKYKKN